MSNSIPISKIRTYEHGDELTAVSGMLENVWERKTGVTKGRPWSIQNLMLKDPTGTIKVTVFGRKEFPKDMEGKQVEFRGVFADDNTYNGKTTRCVKVTEDSTAKLIDNGQQDDSSQVKQSSSSWEGVPPTASNSGGKMVHGATVGMATNKTIDIFISLKKDAEYYAGDQFIYDLHAVASSIIHVSKALEAGQKLEAPNSGPKTTPGPVSTLSAVQNVAGTEPPDDGNFLQEGEELL